MITIESAKYDAEMDVMRKDYEVTFGMSPLYAHPCNTNIFFQHIILLFVGTYFSVFKITNPFHFNGGGFRLLFFI